MCTDDVETTDLRSTVLRVTQPTCGAVRVKWKQKVEFNDALRIVLWFSGWTGSCLNIFATTLNAVSKNSMWWLTVTQLQVRWVWKSVSQSLPNCVIIHLSIYHVKTLLKCVNLSLCVLFFLLLFRQKSSFKTYICANGHLISATLTVKWLGNTQVLEFYIRRVLE